MGTHKTAAYFIAALSIAAAFLAPACSGGSEAGDNKAERPQLIASLTKDDVLDANGKFDYSAYSGALKYVDDKGMVDYEGLKKDREKLDLFVAALGALDKKDFKRFSDEEKIAFWINAYNAITLQAIIDNHPIEPGSFIARQRFPENSIRQIGGVWTDRNHTVMGNKMSLDEIEHQKLRPLFNEPRVHMALVCAAMGCPPLRNEPFTGARLGEQLDDQARRFLANQWKFNIDRQANAVRLSKIFRWFGSDFVKSFGTDDYAGDASERASLNFISGYLGERDRQWLRAGGYDIEFLDYDWSLNEQQ